MTRSTAAALLMTALAITLSSRTPSAQANLTGHWAIDREASQSPKEIGFSTNWATAEGEGSSAAGRGRRGSAPPPMASPFGGSRESEEDARRLRQLTDEVRTPPARLSVVATSDGGIAITSDNGQMRTLRVDGKEQVLRLDGDLPVVATARWEADRLVVLYQVEQGRQLRYTYSVTGSPRQLVVDVKFLERGEGDSVRWIYKEGSAEEPTVQKPAQPSAPAAPAAGLPGTAAQSSPSNADLRPGAELKGLTKVGLVVEGLGSQATSCGLSQDALEKALTKSLTDGGLRVVRNADEDTYLYFNVMTSNLSSGLCVSRYDVSLNTHTTATMPYGTSPALVEIQLLHKGGIAGGAPAAHAQSVVRAATQFVDQFVTQIRDANK